MDSIQGLLDSLAGAGPAVAALAFVFVIVWRQFCALQDKMVKTIETQAAATAQQAASNDSVAKAVSGLHDYLERVNEGELSYRAGMKSFAQTMTALAEGVAKRQDETLREIQAHREATERKGKGHFTETRSIT